MGVLKKVRTVLANRKGGIGPVVATMILLGAAALIASGVVTPFKGDGETTGLPGAAKDMVGQIYGSIEEAGQ